MCFKCWIERIGGMSDLCMYELEDIVWDEFDQTDDRIVPHSGYKHGFEPTFRGDSFKKPRLEVIGILSNAADCSKYFSQGKGGFQHLKKEMDTMLEKDSRSHPAEGVFPASCDSDSNKEATCLAFDNTGISTHAFKSSNTDTIGTHLCAEDPIIGERCAVADSDSYNYPLCDNSQADNGLSFFNNDCEDKESNDLLYYGWPDIGNFEDVDMMFRSSDSAFGLGAGGDEDELGWFSSSQTIEGSEDLLESAFKFSCPQSSPFKNIPEQHEPSKPNNASSSFNASNAGTPSINYKSCSWALEGFEPDTLGHLTFMNGSDTISGANDEFTAKEQINFHKRQAKHHNQLEVKVKDQCLENGGSFHHNGSIGFKAAKLSSGDWICQDFTSPDTQKQEKNIGPDSFGYSRTYIPCMRIASEQIPVISTPSVIKSESNRHTSFSPKESSCASNHVQSIGSSHDRAFDGPALIVDDKSKILYHQGVHPSYLSNPKRLDLVVRKTACDPIPVSKNLHHSQNEAENHSEVEGASIRTSADLLSSNVQENSCVSSGLDKISPEASSFHQLQQVMEQLDIRTKLCIRDSLYRLARSAEQRHHHANLNGSSMDGIDTGGVLKAEEKAKCNGFVDMETDTNPIDRSIAHLLFHRPADSSVNPAHDGVSIKSHPMIQGSIASPPVNASEAEKEVADH